MSEISEPNYYSVTPAEVRYSTGVSAGAKVLYGEIAALCNKEGFCWASNAYLGKLYHTTTRSIQRWISELEGEGFIFVEGREAETGKQTQRKITIGVTKMSPPRHKNVTHNNKNNNNATTNVVANMSTSGREKEVLALIASLTGRSFRVLPRGSAKTLKAFTNDEIKTALERLMEDEWHENKIKELSSDYLLRPTTIDKFLTMGPVSRGYA